MKPIRIIFLVIFSLSFGVAANAQCVATTTDPCVQVNQSLIDRSAKAAVELAEARKVIASFMAERNAFDAERQAAARLITRYEAVIAAQDQLTATHQQMLSLWKDLNAEKDRLIEKYEKQLSAGKTPWQKFLDALKTVVTIGVGIGIGRGL
jgi:hypothetical protein